MKRIKEKLQVLGEKFSNLEVGKKRLLITSAVVAVAIPVLTIASLAIMPTAVNDGGMFTCSDLPNLEANQRKNCDAYTAAKNAADSVRRQRDRVHVLLRNWGGNKCKDVHGTPTCAQRKDEYLAAYNIYVNKYGSIDTIPANLVNEENRTKRLCDNSTSIVNSLKGRCGTNTSGGTGGGGASPQAPTQNASSVNLHFLSAAGAVETAQTINAGGEVANTVLSFFQGDNQAGQPVTATFSLPQGVSLGDGYGIIYNLNNNGWQELPNGANIVTTGTISPSGVPGGQHIHFNVQLQGTAECGKTQTYPINAKIKLADGTELAAQTINLTVKGKACEAPAPTQPAQPANPEVASTVDLYFVSANNTIERTETINAGGEVANTVLSFFQGDKLAGQAVTGIFSLPQGVTLGTGHGILYQLNDGEWKDLQNGTDVVNTGTISPTGVAKGGHINFNIRLQGTAECGKTQTYPINAKIKLADGTELATQAINLTIKGKVCNQTTTPNQPSTPGQTTTPDQANYIKVCDQNTNRIITIKEADFDPKTQTKDLSKCPTTPAALPQTGPADTLIILVALTALTAGAGYYISGRKAKAPKA